jgi:hypothetical protein
MLARQIAIGFGIAVIFPLLVYYGVATFHAPPKLAVVAALAPNPTPEERKEYQQQLRQAQEAFRADAKTFARLLVQIATPLGIAAILVGAYLPLYAIGTGLIFGGIFSVTWGYWNYWQYLDDWMRFVSLLAGFAILLFVGFRRVTGARADSTRP